MADETKPSTVKVYVQALTEKGFRRINRWFGQEMTGPIEVTEDEFRALNNAPTQLRVQTEAAKLESDRLNGIVSAGSPAPVMSSAGQTGKAPNADAPKPKP